MLIGHVTLAVRPGHIARVRDAVLSWAVDLSQTDRPDAALISEIGDANAIMLLHRVASIDANLPSVLARLRDLLGEDIKTRLRSQRFELYDAAADRSELLALTADDCVAVHVLSGLKKTPPSIAATSSGVLSLKAMTGELDRRLEFRSLKRLNEALATHDEITDGFSAYWTALFQPMRFDVGGKL